MALIRKYQTAGPVEGAVFKDELRSNFDANDVANAMIRNGQRFADTYLKGKRRDNLLSYLQEGVKLVREGKISRNAQGQFEVPEGSGTTEYYDTKRKKIVANDNTTKKDFFAYLNYVLDREHTIDDKKKLGIAKIDDKKQFSIDDYLYKVSVEHNGDKYNPLLTDYSRHATALAASMPQNDRITLFKTAIANADYDELSKYYTFEGDLKDKAVFTQRMKDYAKLLESPYASSTYKPAHTGLNGKMEPLYWYGNLGDDKLSYIDPEAKEQKKPDDEKPDAAEAAKSITYNYLGSTYNIPSKYNISQYDSTKAKQVFTKLTSGVLSYQGISSVINGSDKTPLAINSYILQQYCKLYPKIAPSLGNNYVLLPWTINGSGDQRVAYAFHVPSGKFQEIDYASAGPGMRSVFDKYARRAQKGMKVPKFQDSGQFYWNTAPRNTKSYSNVAWIAGSDATQQNAARWEAFKKISEGLNDEEAKQNFITKFNNMQTRHGVLRQQAKTSVSGDQYSENWTDKVGVNPDVQSYQDDWKQFQGGDYLNATIINPYRETRYKSTTTGTPLGMDTAASPSDGLFGAITDDRRFWRDDEDVSAYLPDIEKMGMELYKDTDGYQKLRLKPVAPLPPQEESDEEDVTPPDTKPEEKPVVEPAPKVEVGTPGIPQTNLNVKNHLSALPFVNLAKLFTGLGYNRRQQIAWREPYKQHIVNNYRIVGDYAAKTRAQDRGLELLRTVGDNLGADTRDNAAMLLTAQDKYGDYVERGNLIDSAAQRSDYDDWITGIRADKKDDRDVAFYNHQSAVNEINNLIEGNNKKLAAEAKMWDNYLTTLGTDIAANDAVRRKALQDTYPRTLNDIYTQLINNATSETERAQLRAQWQKAYLESLGQIFSSNPYLVGTASINYDITGPTKKAKKSDAKVLSTKKGGSLTYEERANLQNARETNKAIREARKDSNRNQREGNKIIANHLKPKRRRR